MKLKAFAKINLSLRVFERRADGYHTLESVMQSVSLCDYVTIDPIPAGIEITCDDPRVPTGKENIVYKAVEAYYKKVDSKLGIESRKLKIDNRGWKIYIEKHIPMAAGLAGGSADAAAVLYGLNLLSNIDCRLSNIELSNIASQVGSDVPFCLTGGTCLVKGRGEIVEKLEPWPQTYFVLVNPDLAVSTKWAYDEFDRLHLTVSSRIKNDLEQVVMEKYPVIAEIKNQLLTLGCNEAQMSGSGSTVFGMSKNKNDAERICKIMREKYPKTFLVESVNIGVENA
ncbi:MAG: 4-(cytidine 5'-diphospho)-2-C-methyl-D-erythritol kinase [Candidatus Margulisiibacteriota bacterium]